VNTNITQNFVTMQQVIVRALEPHPEAKFAVTEALAALEREERERG